MPTPKSNRPTVVEHNIETNEIVEREMNDAEYENFLADKAETDSRAAAIAAKATARQAILDRLGLTADEAAILLS